MFADGAGFSRAVLLCADSRVMRIPDLASTKPVFQQDRADRSAMTTIG
jgi:hypothetical protein